MKKLIFLFILFQILFHSVGISQRPRVPALQLDSLLGPLNVPALKYNSNLISITSIKATGGPTNVKYLRGDSSWAIVPIIDTTSLSNRINLKVNITDTAAMLIKYVRKSDTLGMLLPYLRVNVAAATYATISNLALKVNYSDTAAMLSTYLRSSVAAATYATITNLALKINISDSSAMLNPYLRGGSIAWPGTVYSTPTTGVVSGHNITYSPALANQSAYTVFSRGSGSGTPSFNSQLDSNYLAPGFHTQGYNDLRYQATGTGMVYPGNGIANSTGTAWGTSYGVSGSGNVALTGSPTFTGTVNGASSIWTGTNPQLTLVTSGSFGYQIGRNTGTGYLDILGNQGTPSVQGINVNGGGKFTDNVSVNGKNLVTQWAPYLGIGATTVSGVPTAMLHIIGNTQDIKISADNTGSADYRIARNNSTGFLDFSGTQSGFVGYTFSGGNITLNNIPTTSAGTYDILTRNTGTGVMEKIASTTFPAGSGSSGNLVKWTGTNTQGNSLLQDDGGSYVNLTQSVNSGVRLNITNNSAGNAAYSDIEIGNAGNLAYQFKLGAGYTTSGILVGGRYVIDNNDAAGTFIGSRQASGIVGFFTGGLAAANERMRIDASGNVGIGSTTPTLGRLVVKGNYSGTTQTQIEFNGFTGYSSIESIDRNAGTAKPLVLYGTTVSINTATPLAMFHISGTQTASSAYARGEYNNVTLSAAANNDTLSASTLQPTFTLNSKTGVAQYFTRGLDINGVEKYNIDGSGNFASTGNININTTLAGSLTVRNGANNFITTSTAGIGGGSTRFRVWNAAQTRTTDIYGDGWYDNNVNHLFYISATQMMGINASGIQMLGNVTFTNDNANDLGASLATRPRTGYFGTSVQVPLGSVSAPGYTFSGLTTPGQSGMYANAGGTILFTNNGTLAGYFAGGGTGDAYINAQNRISIGPAENVRLYYNGSTTNLVAIGGITSSFPAMARNGAGLDFKLADNSGYALINSGTAIVNGTIDNALKVIGTSGGGLYLGAFSGSSTVGGIWSNQVTPSTTNYAIGTNATSVTLNSTSTTDLANNGTPMFRVSTNAICMSNLTFSTDNTYDIGASGATRPRNYYGGGTVSFLSGAGATPITLSAITNTFIVDAGGAGRTAAMSGTQWTMGQWGSDAVLSVGSGGSTNRAGFNMKIVAGISTGNVNGGDIVFQSSSAGSSGGSLNTANDLLRIGYNGVITSAAAITNTAGNTFTTNHSISASVNNIGTNFISNITTSAGASGTIIAQQATINQNSSTNLPTTLNGFLLNINHNGTGTIASAKGVIVQGFVADGGTVTTNYGYSMTGLFTPSTGTVGTQYGYYYDQTYITPTTGYAFYSTVNPSGGTLASLTDISIKPGTAKGVSIGSTTAAASALLDITSTTKGILIPRMTLAQRNAISSPAEGLQVYDNESHNLHWYNGSAWKTFGDSASAGGGSGWALPGNAGTTSGNQFIGTTDNMALNVRTNNVVVARFDSLGSRLFLTGGVDPLLSLKQATSNQEYRIRVGLNSGVANSGYNLYDATASKIRMYFTTSGRLGLGNISSVPTSSALFVNNGNSTGANIDARGDSTLMDEANIECELHGYDGAYQTGLGIAIQADGPSVGFGTVFGYPLASTSQLRFNNLKTLINVQSLTSLRVGIGGTERFVFDSTGSFGINTQVPAVTAILEAKSTTKGILIPRLTTTQRDAISSPATGLKIYNTDNGSDEWYNGYSWGGAGLQSQPGRVTSNFTVASSTTLTNVTGLTANVIAGKTYFFIAKIYQTPSVGGGKYAINGTATATAIVYNGVSYDPAIGIANNSITSTMGAVVANSHTPTPNYTEISGTITVNAGGTLTVQFAQNQSNATASTVLRGSTFVVQEIL